VSVRCAQAAGPRDDPSLTLGRTCDDPFSSALAERDDPNSTHPGPAGGRTGA
jgi:hypothetical protein